MNILPALSQKDERDQAFVRFEPPTVASFTKFIDHPVSLYSGTPDVNVPIYTLKDGAIEIPIALRYNTSGIKVNEEASWVGLGWNLNVGGVIVQNSVGKKDSPIHFNEYSNYYHPISPFERYSQVVYRVGDKNSNDGFFHRAKMGELEPDAFYFSYPGNSGKFFIDYRDNTTHQLKREKPIKIEYQSASKTWKITTETGLVHTFGNLKNSYADGAISPVSTTYYLTNTLYPNGQSIQYSYRESVTYNFDKSEYQVVALSNSSTIAFSGFSTPETSNSIVKGHELTLSSIKTSNYQIDFTTSSRIDLINGLKLDEIQVSALKSEWNVTPKKFKLNYDYFVSTTFGNYWTATSEGNTYDLEKLKRRLKLLSVHEVIGTSTVHNKHSFDYETQELPVKTSYAADYWGYYNGQTANNHSIPDYGFLLNDSELGLRFSQLQGYKANRAYNFATCKAGMLKKITYPTGGHSTYDYAANVFTYNSFIPTINEQRGKSNRVVDRNNTGDERSHAFTLTSSSRFVFNWRLEKGLNSWGDMSGSKYIITKDGSTFVSQEVPRPASSSTSVAQGEFTMTLAPGNYTIAVDIPDYLGDQYGSMRNHGQLELTMTGKISRSYSEGAGLRVSKIDFFESASLYSPTYSVTYEYPNPGVLYIPPYYYRTYSVTDAIAQPNTTILASHEEAHFSSNRFCSAPYSAIGVVGYSTVKERITSGGVVAGRKEYSFYNSGEISAASMSIQIPDPRNGTPECIYNYNNESTLVKSEIFDYSFNKIHHYWGVNLIDNFNRTPSFYTSPLVESVGSFDYGDYYGRYTTMLYPLGSYEMLMTGKRTTVDNVTTTETYEYNSHGLRTKSTITQSDNKSNVTQVTYPTDYNCGIFATMVAKNMLAFPVEERNVINGNLAKGSLTQYKTQGSNVVPASISNAVTPSSGNPTGFSCSGAVPTVYPNQNIKILNYDSQSNPIYITKNDTEHVVYIWGYNYQYPVAEIKGATYGEVKTALGNVGPETLSSVVNPNMSTINGLRAKLPKTLITTYTYKPLTGILTMTAPHGEVTTFTYDAYGRLVNAKDHNGKFIEKYEYNYR